MAFLTILISLTTLIFGPPKPTHDFHVGIAQMEYNQKSKTYEISLKLFTDDLENVIQQSTGQTLKLSSDREQKDADEWVFNYVVPKFNLLDKNYEPLVLNIIGRESDMDLTWIYLESEKTKAIAELSVRTELFFEVFSDQSFLIHLIQDGETRSLYLHSGRTQDSFKK